MDRSQLLQRFPFSPDFTPAVLARDRARLLAPGPLDLAGLERRLALLERDYCSYAGCYPYGLWAPGLILTPPMRSLTELCLPLAEICRTLVPLLAKALTVPAIAVLAPLTAAASWPDLLQQLGLPDLTANPAALVRRLAADAPFRERFLFALALPRQHGSSFARYPGQRRFLQQWLMERRERVGSALRCLDAACGSGEGTYALARLVREAGWTSESSQIEGVTINPLEVFAAARGYFPHDPARQTTFRQQAAASLADGWQAAVHFRWGDIREVRAKGEGYDLIVCNGILGGPLLSGEQAVAATISRLAGLLRPAGLLLAADRFHAGWKRLLPPERLTELLAGAGLEPVELPEGTGGIRTGRPCRPRRAHPRSPS